MRHSRIGNLSNRFQGDYRRVLAVCSAGLLRSPTIAHTLCQPPYNYNTRSAGIESSYALNILDEAMLCWAQEIVCADQEHMDRVCELLENCASANWNTTTVLCLNLPDIYEYRNPELVGLILERYPQDETWKHARQWSQGQWRKTDDE